MKSIIYARISKSDLLCIFGIGEIVLNRWKKRGMPCESNGRFSLSKVVRWREKDQQIERGKIDLAKISQSDIIEITGLSRHSIFRYFKSGMPRSSDRSYALGDVVKFVLECHRRSCKIECRRKIERLQKKLRKNIAQMERLLSDSGVC